MPLAASQLAMFVEAVFRKVGVPDPDALLVADTLVEADLRGVHSHGVMRLPIYIKRIQAGLVRPQATVTTTADGPAFAQLDAHGSLGQVVGARGIDLAIRKAREAGVGVVGVAHSTHFGAAAYYAMRAAAERMVGIAITNTLPLMPPVGGAAPIVGNNPIAYAIPAGRHRPVVLDIATSVVARGKVQRAQGRGDRVPLDWGVNRQGQPTDRPEEIMEGGMLLPFGAHKGFGLAMIFDLLCGPLAGGGWSAGVAGLALPEHNRPQEVGHLFAAVDVARFRPLPEFLAEVDRYIDMVHATPRAPGVERLYVPGEIEFEMADARRRDGVPLDAHVVKGLEALAEEFSLDPIR
ncbi:MAG TPA: Ldh family oxidoreductase [bacterium]|nr:Ldh family oxidoreductase [bacterium]